MTFKEKFCQPGIIVSNNRIHREILSFDGNTLLVRDQGHDIRKITLRKYKKYLKQKGLR